MNGRTLGIALAVAVSSYALADLMRRYASQLGFTDLPNDRSLHSGTTPRGGGVGFALLVPIAIIIYFYAITSEGRLDGAELTLLLSGMLLALVGLADDRWTLPVAVKLSAHVCAAAAVVAAGGLIRQVQVPDGPSYDLGILAAPLTMLWLIGLTNIYNFMDGIDGLAGAQAIVAALTMAVLAACAGHPELAATMVILAAGVSGFIWLNWSPARIFMGDVGSTFLGFMFAGLAVLSGSMREAPLPLIAWIAVLSPFLFDSSLTLVVRAYRGERLHQPHRDHIYQHLVRDGWSHSRTATLYAGLASLAGGLTLLHYCLGLIPGPIYLILTLLAVLVPLLTLDGRRAGK